MAGGDRGRGKHWRNLCAAALACGALAVQTGCRAEQPWPLWKSYQKHFVDSSNRVIDHSMNDRTTSEGMAYAMFFALVVDDRSTFEKLLRWTEDNLAAGDMTARLPSWNWGKNPGGEWKVLDPNSASDADVWIAYDLLEAGRLWNDDRLTKLGEVMADHIAHSEVVLVPGIGTVLIPGPQGFHPGQSSYLLNPSYTPLQLIARLKQQQPTGPWGTVLDSAPALIRASAPAGFVMDWVQAGSSVTHAGTPQEVAEGKTTAVPVGSYDAIRVYLWLGMADRATPGVATSLAAVTPMAQYMQANVLPPLRVDAAGKAVDSEGPIGFSAAVVPYLTAVGRKVETKQQMTRVQASMDSSTGLYGHNPQYYDQNLAMFAMGWQEGRFRFDRDGRLKLKWK